MTLLDGKVAVITGAGRGIGRAEALLFAREGARVVVNDLGTAADGSGSDPLLASGVADEITRAGGTAIATSDDVASPEGPARIVARALEAFGQIDILVNNAGASCDAPLLDLSRARLDDLLRIFVHGTLGCTQHVARQMMTQGEGGRIVNTTGLGGLRGDLGSPCAIVAEATIWGLTRASAIALEPHGITVNAVAPVARTRLTALSPKIEGLDPLTPDQVAPATLFLASPLCGHRTGEVLASAGNRLSRFRVIESRGRFKEGDSPWTPQEIAEHWDALAKP